MKRWYVLPLAGCAVLATAFLAWASLTRDGMRAVYDTDFGVLTVEVLDRNHVRLNSDDALELLITEGKGYVLRRQGEGWLVIPLSELMTITGTHAVEDSEVRLRVTDNTEQVAGYAGRVYLLESRRNGEEEWTESGELVLSDDPATRKLGEAFAAIAELVGGHRSIISLTGGSSNSLSLEDFGLLRYDGIRLRSTSRITARARDFRLPQGALVMPVDEPESRESVYPSDDAPAESPTA